MRGAFARANRLGKLRVQGSMRPTLLALALMLSPAFAQAQDRREDTRPFFEDFDFTLRCDGTCRIFDVRRHRELDWRTRIPELLRSADQIETISPRRRRPRPGS
jgi:hypothetical protein